MNSLLKKLGKMKPIIFLDQLIFRVIDDEVFVTGTQLTFFLILSVFPFIIMLLNILSYTPFVRPDALQNVLVYLPDATQKIFTSFINEITISSSQSLLSISAVLGLWSSSAGIKAVIKAIDKAYNTPEKRSYIKLRIMSLFFTVALIILIVLVLLTLVFGEVLANKIFSLLGLTFFFKKLWQYIRILIPILFMILIFALLYKFSPVTKEDNNISFLSTFPGATFTTLGWMITSILFSYYVNNFGRYAVTYGSLVGVILLFIWLYISSIIIVLGGEINATIDFFKTHGYQLHKGKTMLGKLIEEI